MSCAIGVLTFRGRRPHYGTLAVLESAYIVKSESELIEAAQQGDSVAFGKLVGMYQDRLYHAMSHICGSPDEAEDVVQETLVQAFFRLNTFQRRSSLYTWLYRIAMNRALNRKRQERGSESVERRAEDLGSEPLDPRDSPGENLMRQERATQVHAALARLSEEYRTVIVLREMEGFSYDTIAEIVGISVGTVRSRLHRARSLMREALKGIFTKK